MSKNEHLFSFFFVLFVGVCSSCSFVVGFVSRRPAERGFSSVAPAFTKSNPAKNGTGVKSLSLCDDLLFHKGYRYVPYGTDRDRGTYHTLYDTTVPVLLGTGTLLYLTNSNHHHNTEFFL